MSKIVHLTKHAKTALADRTDRFDEVLPVPSVEAIFDAVQICEISLGVSSRNQFEAWVRGPLNSLIPHEKMIVWLTRPDNVQIACETVDVRVEHPLSIGRDTVRQRAEVQSLWQRSDFAPVLSTAAVSGCALELPAEAKILVHGVPRLYGSGCLFILVGDETTHASAAVATIELLAPYIQLAVHRIAGLSLPRMRQCHPTEMQAKASTLSARELRVLEFVRDGKSNQEIGRALNISPFTVKSHLQRVFRKLGVSNRTQAVAKALGMRLLRASH